jgi:hypothetical protein
MAMVPDTEIIRALLVFYTRLSILTRLICPCFVNLQIILIIHEIKPLPIYNKINWKSMGVME